MSRSDRDSTHNEYTPPVDQGPLLTNQFSNSRSDQKRAKALNDAIDKSLRADKERQQREAGIKLLILGEFPRVFSFFVITQALQSALQCHSTQRSSTDPRSTSDRQNLSSATRISAPFVSTLLFFPDDQLATVFFCLFFCSILSFLPSLQGL